MEVLMSSSLSCSSTELMLKTIRLWFWPSDDDPKRLHFCFPDLAKSHNTNSPLPSMNSKNRQNQVWAGTGSTQTRVYRRDDHGRMDVHLKQLDTSCVGRPFGQWTFSQILSRTAGSTAEPLLFRKGSFRVIRAVRVDSEFIKLKTRVVTTQASSLTFPLGCAPDPHSLVFAPWRKEAAGVISSGSSVNPCRQLEKASGLSKYPSHGKQNGLRRYRRRRQLCCRERPHRSEAPTPASGSRCRVHGDGASRLLSDWCRWGRSSRLCTCSTTHVTDNKNKTDFQFNICFVYKQFVAFLINHADKNYIYIYIKFILYLYKNWKHGKIHKNYFSVKIKNTLTSFKTFQTRHRYPIIIRWAKVRLNLFGSFKLSFFIQLNINSQTKKSETGSDLDPAVWTVFGSVRV